MQFGKKEKGLLISSRVKHILTLWFISSTPSYIKKICPQKKILVEECYSSLIHDDQKLDTGQESINKRTDKQPEETIDKGNAMNQSQKHYVE